MSLSVQQAAEVMGEHFVGVAPAERRFGAMFSLNKARVAKAVFDEKTLENMKHSHALILDTGTCIVAMRRAFPSAVVFSEAFADGPWYDQMKFGQVIEGPQWRLVPLAPIPFSVDKTKTEQDEFLATWALQTPRRTVALPLARQVAFATMMLSMEKGLNILPDGAAIRGRDVEKDGRSPVVGPFIDGVLTISAALHSHQSRTLGVMAFPNHRWYHMPE